MQALLSRNPGGPETLTFETIAPPAPNAGEVLVAIHACGVNFSDSLIIADRYQVKPQRPFAPGGEIAGVIAAIGPGVTEFQPGDRVLASCGSGGMAELAVVSVNTCVKIPDSMPFDEAAVFITAYGSAYHALKDRARLRSGATLLVLGAAGGVGLAAVELGAAMGAHVIAAVSSLEKSDFVREHGAVRALVYPKGPFDAEGEKALAGLFKAAVGPEGAHAIYDPVGGEYATSALRAIAWGGKYLVIGFAAGIPKMPLNLPFIKGCDICGVFWGEAVRRDPAGHAENVRDLMRFYEMGLIRPIITERFSLKDGPAAIEWIMNRKALGKVVIIVTETH